MNFLLFLYRHIQHIAIGILAIGIWVLSTIPALMAGKIYGVVGEKVSITLSDLPSGSEVEWVLSQNGTIIETKTGKAFNKSFATAGEYVLRATAQGDESFQSSSTIDITIGATLPNFSPLQSVLKTIPDSSNGKVELPGQKATVTFSFGDSTGSIESYALESDAFSDGDNDGVIDNDIDNKNDISYSSGSYFQKTYTNDGIPKKAILTVRGKNGETSTSSVLIVFSEAATTLQNEQKGKDLLPKLESIPQSNAQGNIAISPRTNTILLYANTSEGNIQEYRIDTDSTIDSDNDGQPNNDVNNAGTDSLSQGSVFPIAINTESLPKTISLTIVDAMGNKKTVQKSIIIDPAMSSGPQSNAEFLTPILFASRSKIAMGESVVFKLFNIAPDASISWDFNGDGKWDIEKSTETEVEYKYAEEGNYNVRTEIIQVGSAPLISKAQVSVASSTISRTKTFPPKAHFLAQKEGNRVSFLSSESAADENLLDPNLSYSWDFGDGYKAEGPNPIHIYEKPGLYTISLTVEDSIERSAVFVDNIEILEIPIPFDKTQHGGKSWLTEILPESTPLPVIDAQTTPNTQTPTSKPQIDINIPWIIWVLLGLLMIPFLFLIKKKIDNPSLSFDEILKTLVEGWKSKKEKRIIENNGSATALPAIDQLSTTASPTQENRNTPDWMRSYDPHTTENITHTVDSPMVDDEVEETRQTMENIIPDHIDDVPENKQEHSPSDSNTLPDWLQGSTREENSTSDSTEKTDAEIENTAEESKTSSENIPMPTEANTGALPDWLSGNQGNAEENAQDQTASLIENTPADQSISTQDQNATTPFIEDEIFTTLIDDSDETQEENPFTTDRPEWLNEILETPYFEIPMIDSEENLLPKTTWEENDSDEILGISSKSNNIAQNIPESYDRGEDEGWDEESEDDEYSNFDDDEDWWQEEEAPIEPEMQYTNDSQETISPINEKTEEKNISNNEKEESIPTSPIITETDSTDLSTQALTDSLALEESILPVEKNTLSKNIENTATQIPDQSIPNLSDKNIDEIPEEILITAKDAKIPVSEDSSHVPTWIQR